MFDYDQRLQTAAQATPATIADVIATMQTIQSLCADADGLKWFNWLYMQVTLAVEQRVAGGGFADLAWLGLLDVEFAKLYFGALAGYLSGGAAAESTAGCWRALFDQRSQAGTARIQFALTGINAHINHDLPMALVTACEMSNLQPVYGGTQYNDYTAVNSTLESVVDQARQTLLLGLAGEPIPGASALEDRLAAWSVVAAREAAWTNAEVLWGLRGSAGLSARFMDVVDGLTTVAGKTLLQPLPPGLA